MELIVILVFLGIFTVVAAVAMAVGSGASERTKQALASLDSALATESPAERDQILNVRRNDVLSAIPWLNKKLLQFQLAPLIYNLLRQADLKWTAGGLIAGCGLCFLIPGYLVFLRFGSVLIALIVGLAFAFAPVGYALFKRSKRFNKFQEGLPEALDLIVNALRAGHSLIAAMGLVARECADPVGSEFKACFEEQNYGLELTTALDNLIVRVPLQDMKIVATAITIQKESGGNLAEVLDKTAHVIRERFRLKRQIKTHTAQGRLTGIILTCLPLGLGIVLYILNPKSMSLLWTTPVGVKLLIGGCCGIVLGGFIINRIVDMEV
ncbi:MAG: type II secretion system F family protein [Terracidiphilus sp.]|jgi:tight adherence protein B